jgi:flavin reductase ActVB
MPVDSTQMTQPSPTVARSSDFTEAMTALASGVVMVTSWLDGRPWGVTVSAFASVSAEPPTVLVSLSSETASARAIAAAGRFGVSVLGRHHRAVARHGAQRGAAKFLERFSERDGRGVNPSIAGALAHLDCDVTEQVQVADHTIFIGRVRDVRPAVDGEPLVYFRRAYRALAAGTNPSTRGRTLCLSS